MSATLENQVDAVVAAYDFGRASAAKRGRRHEWPYVPVIDFGIQATGVHRTRTEQIRGRAFATRNEAVSYAERVISARRLSMREKLLDPRWRAFRRHFGLPEEVAK